MSELTGLRVVLGVSELAEMAQLRRRIQEMEVEVAIAADAKITCPVVAAEPGDVFIHHTMDANHANWEDDAFVYVGRADGMSRTPAGWLIFRHLEVGRGICAYGCNGGLNGGMRDAIGAWPLADYFNYKPDGSINSEHEIALPLDMCWAFRKPPVYEDDDDEGPQDLELSSA